MPIAAAGWLSAAHPEAGAPWTWSCWIPMAWDLIRVSGRSSYGGALILMSGGFELYLKMAEEIAGTNDLNVVGKLPKPFRPKQFAYLLMSLL